MRPSELGKDLESGRLKPIYLLHGQDLLRQKRYADRISEMVGQGLEDLNLEHLTAEENPASDVIDRALSMPFLAPPRIIILRGADRYSTEEISLFKSYLDDPNESTCLVLIAEKPDFRLGFFKGLQQAGWTVNFDPPRGRELADWVVETGKRLGHTVTPAAARLLIDRVGADLIDLNNELEKVCLYAGPGAAVDADQVEAASSLSRTASIFELGDAVGEQNPARALSALKGLLLKEHPLMILAMIVRHFHLLAKARALLDQGEDTSTAHKTLGVPSFAARNYLNQARRLNADQLQKALSSLLKADLALKSSGAPERLILEGLILELSALKAETRAGLRPARP